MINMKHLHHILPTFYTPRNEVEAGYTGFTLFVRPSVRRWCPGDNLNSFHRISIF